METNDVPKVKRQPVTFRYDALNHDFIKLLAEIAYYAANKYGSAEQYADGRLEGEKSPVNHIYEHLRQYQTGEKHDHFGDPIYHLAAIAYNAMMEALYLRRWGHKLSPLDLIAGKATLADCVETTVRNCEEFQKRQEHKRQCQVALENGYESHKVGKRLCDNPTARGSQDAAYWEEGWRKRHHELCYGKEWGTK
jgi:hypothetical protein